MCETRPHVGVFSFSQQWFLSRVQVWRLLCEMDPSSASLAFSTVRSELSSACRLSCCLFMQTLHFSWSLCILGSG